MDDFFGIALVLIFVVKAVAEYLGVVEIQYVGQAAITDLRNQHLRKTGSPADRLSADAIHRAADLRSHQRCGAGAHRAFGFAGPFFPLYFHLFFL